MDGGLEVHRHRAVRLPGAAPPPQRRHHAGDSKSFMDQDNSELHKRNWRQGEVLRDAGIKVFQIETTVNNDLYGDGPLSVLAKREWEWTTEGPGHVHGGPGRASTASPPPTGAGSCTAGEAPYAMTSVQAGEVEAVHKLTTAARLRPAAGTGRGPDRRAGPGTALRLPLQRELDHEPDPGHVPGPGVLLQPVQGAAAGARGRRADHEPPHHAGLPPGAPPQLHRLLRGGPGRHHRPDRDGAALRAQASPRTSGTATCTGPATPTTACTRSTCGTGAATRWSTWAA